MAGKFWINYLFTVLFSIPMIGVLAFLSYLIRVIIIIGRIPEYNNPDPNLLNIETHREIVMNLVNVTIFSFPFLILLLIILWVKKNSYKKRMLNLYAIGLLIFVWIFYISKIGEWFAD